MKEKHYREEEHFHSADRKGHRKERRRAEATDRSKFKKSDQKETVLPEFSHLPRGRVVSIRGEGILVEQTLCQMRGLMKKEWIREKNLVAVGDWVRYSPEERVIEQVEPRYSILARREIRGQAQQVIATNVDQLLIVASIAAPPLKPALIDRYLIAAEKGNIHPIICLNKIDLVELEEELYEATLAAYEPLGIPILSVSAETGVGLESLRNIMRDKVTLLSGQSGVGKSSLLNAAFGMERKTGRLAEKTAKGTHTTTSSELIPLPGGGYTVDTPGIRSFSLWELTRQDLLDHFRDFPSCKFPDCSHCEEPGCRVREELEAGRLSPLRYGSYLTLLDDLKNTSKPTWEE